MSIVAVSVQNDLLGTWFSLEVVAHEYALKRVHNLSFKSWYRECRGPLTVIIAKNIPNADPAKTSHQWCRWSVIRDTEHRHAQNSSSTCSKSKRNWLRIRGIRRCKYLEADNFKTIRRTHFGGTKSKQTYQIMKIASKKLIDEWPEGNDFELSLTKNCLSTVFVQVYSEINSLKCHNG